MRVDEAAAKSRDTHDPLDVDQADFRRGIRLASHGHIRADLAGKAMGLFGYLASTAFDVYVHSDCGGRVGIGCHIFTVQPHIAAIGAGHMVHTRVQGVLHDVGIAVFGNGLEVRGVLFANQDHQVLSCGADGSGQAAGLLCFGDFHVITPGRHSQQRLRE